MNAFRGKKLSAGRVQTPVLGKIVDRREAVEAFEPETFYRVSFDWTPEIKDVREDFRAELIRIEDRPIGLEDDEELLTDEDEAESIVKAVREEGVSVVSRFRDENESHPRRPFDSSTLIQAASGWFGWSANRTMNTAQSLYEKGLITYHRSDSDRLSRDACKQIAAYVRDEYGSEYHQWRGGGGGDQEGHEAIRPKYPGLEPDELHSVSGAERTLYSAIWQRTIRSQMVPALWDRLVFTFEEDETESIFESEVRALEEPGFYRCLRPDETPRSQQEYSSPLLDALEGSDRVDVREVRKQSSETTGPDLHTEGSIVSMMKKEGIGRPSTYGSTIRRLINRQYIRREDGSILPTQRGRDVLYFLRRAVPRICQVEFTESMEETLDEIARGQGDWSEFVGQFDEKLTELLDEAEELEPEGNAETRKELFELEDCPRCEGDLYLREGQYGEFVHCESDDCDFSSNPPAKTYKCPECGRHMVKNQSTVYRCIAHPECEGRRPVGEPHMTYEEFQQEAPDCPSCDGTMVKRKGRWGNFWGCENYPDCEETMTMD
jgi:DNA topoisomerase-1